MNGYTLKAKGIRSKKSIILEMIMYGFSNEDIVEFTGYKLMTGRGVGYKFNKDMLFKNYKYNPLDVVEKKEIEPLVFSLNEMDYGYSGQQKYNYKGLSLSEQIIFNKI